MCAHVHVHARMPGHVLYVVCGRIGMIVLSDRVSVSGNTPLSFVLVLISIL